MINNLWNRPWFFVPVFLVGWIATLMTTFVAAAAAFHWASAPQLIGYPDTDNGLLQRH